MNIGVDIGGSHISIGVVDEKGVIIEKKYRDIIGEEKNRFIEIIEEYIPVTINMLKDKYKIEKIGIAIPGTVDFKKIIESPNLNINNYNIVENLQKKINIPIKIKNDAKCACIAEHIYGNIKTFNNAIMLTIGTGIGGAVIINNKLLEISKYPAFEFGHMIIEKNGKQCKCGKKGCFETYASMKVLKDELRNSLGLDKTTRGSQLLEIISIDKENNIIKEVIDNYIENLSIGISNLIDIFEPEAIVIGGSFIYFDKILIPKLKEKILNSELLYNEKDNITILPAYLGNDAGIIGATLI